MRIIRSEYSDLKKENDLVFSTLAERDRDTITDILNTINNTRGLRYEVELVRKDLIGMAARAEAQGQPLTDDLGDVALFKCELLASMPRPRLADYMIDSLVWLGFYSFAVSATQLVLRGPWDCYYDAVWLALCIVIMMPSAWLLQRVVPAEWLTAGKGARYGVTTAALLALWFIEFRCVERWIVPHLPTMGLPNLAAVVLFGVLTAALCALRTKRQNAVAEKRPWRDVMEK